jgi:uncharacterized protein YyaL (SSP411 family)
MRYLASLLFIVLATTASANPIHWVSWNDSLFAQAKREHRFVLLDLEAVWCHWCHVMDETTYADPKVASLINARYIAVKVDQDARPDLSNRYEDYGWPATIVFNTDGSEIVKRRGYMPPEQMASMLQAIIDDPSPGPSVVVEPKPQFGSEALLSAALRSKLEGLNTQWYDTKNGGWGFTQKYLDVPSVEYALARAGTGDAAARTMARQTLDGERHLIDPVWGGVYQYSTGGGWNEPHFEKIMSMQAGNLRVASLAYAQWGDPRDLAAAQTIRRYLITFLRSPEGSFWTSQNADRIDGEHAAGYFALSDAGRRAKGIPRIDKHRYARENGWAAEALTALATATGDRAPLDEARAAMEWCYAHLRRSEGGFLHGVEPETNAGGPFLGDTLAIARADLALYAATADRVWLIRAEETAAFIEKTFTANPGFRTSGSHDSVRQRDENVEVARFANLLGHYSGNPRHLAMAKNAMRFLAAERIATPWPVGGVLLADLEMRQEPLHVTVVGAKGDAAARTLFAAAAKIPASFKRVDWLDSAEGPLPNADAEYPKLRRAAAFLCSANRCSRPAYNAAELKVLVDRLARP